MAERFATCISIGGQLRRQNLRHLLDAIRTATVACDWGDASFAPQSEADLASALKKKTLWLCDDEARWGEFPELEATCRALGLAYTRRSDGGVAYDAEVVEWRTGMRKPFVRHGSNHNHATFVPSADVARALRQLDAGRVARARTILAALCPRIPRLPAFVIV